MHFARQNVVIVMAIVFVAMFASIGFIDVSDASCSDDREMNPIYSADTVVISLDPNGGTVEQTEVQCTYSTLSDGTIRLVLGQIPEATRPGYVFAGWFMGSYDDPLGFIPHDPVSSYTYLSEGTIDDLDTWYAVWFEPGNGYAFSNIDGFTELEPHTYITVPEGSFVYFDYQYEDITHEGADWMRFQRWSNYIYVDFGYGFAEVGEDVIIKGYGVDSMKTTIHVVPVPKSVQFISNGTVLETMTVDSGATVIAPDDPELYGFVFTGWYTEDGTPFDFTTPITQNITLYAGWDGLLQFTTDPVSNGSITALDGIPGTVSFNAVSSLDYISVQWNFGDGSTSDNLYATHYYPEAGVYTATLTVFNNYGSDTTEFIIEVPAMADGGGGDSDLLMLVAAVLAIAVAGGLVVRRLL